MIFISNGARGRLQFSDWPGEDDSQAPPAMAIERRTRVSVPGCINCKSPPLGVARDDSAAMRELVFNLAVISPTPAMLS